MSSKHFAFIGTFTVASLCFAGPGRIEISSLPFTITDSGSYVVTENLSGSSGQDGIIVNADDVRLDLNGFTLDGVTTNSRDGIRVSANRKNLSVLNGIIKNWGDDGIDATNAVGGRFESLILSYNSNAGMEVGFNCVVERCISYRNGTLLFPSSPTNANALGDGFRVENGSTMNMLLSIENSHHAIRGHSGSSVRRSIMRNNGHDGFHGSHATVVEGCIAAENSEGLEVDSGSRILHSVAFKNAEDGIRNKGADTNIVQDLSGGGVFSGNVTSSNLSNNIDIRGPGTLLEGCVSLGAGDHGIRIVAGSVVKNNLGVWTLTEDNFRVEDGNGSRLDGNHSIEAAGTDEGIQIDDDSHYNFVVRNSASGDDRIKLGNGTNHGDEVNPNGGFSSQAWSNYEYVP